MMMMMMMVMMMMMMVMMVMMMVCGEGSLHHKATSKIPRKLQVTSARRTSPVYARFTTMQSHENTPIISC